MNSLISEMPGPDVVVIERAPAQPAPIAMPTAASSSSAWMTAERCSPFSLFLYFVKCSASASASDELGVIGYHVKTVQPAIKAPSADDELPSMRIFPA